MPSLQEAVQSRLDESTITGTCATYTGTIDTTWCIGSVPQGGYSLSLILNAVLAFMRTPEVASTDVRSVCHHDPLLLSATYIQAVAWIPFEVRIRVLKRGKSLSNIQADLYQDDQLRITTQVLMTNFVLQKESADKSRVGTDADDATQNGYTLTSRSQWAPSFPLCPPSVCKPAIYFDESIEAKGGKKFGFGKLLTTSSDPKHVECTLKGNTLTSGVYYTLTRHPPLSLPQDKVKNGRLAEGINLIPFLVDMLLSPPMMISGKHEPHWYPTLHLTIEFKRQMPSKKIVDRSATYSKGRFMINGQHETDGELWSHPDDANLFEGQQAPAHVVQAQGKASRVVGKSYILAIARQTALVLPFAVNVNKTKAKL